MRRMTPRTALEARQQLQSLAPLFLPPPSLVWSAARGGLAVMMAGRRNLSVSIGGAADSEDEGESRPVYRWKVLKNKTLMVINRGDRKSQVR